MRPEILTDFTTDQDENPGSLDRLQIPAFSEANMFDAVTDTADRMSDIEGRKAILLIASGIDTFSKLTYDQTRKKLQEVRRADLRHRPDADAARDDGCLG